MLESYQNQYFDQLIQLIADGSLDFGFIKGVGLGAPLLAVVAIVFLLRQRKPLSDQIGLLEVFKERVESLKAKDD